MKAPIRSIRLVVCVVAAMAAAQLAAEAAVTHVPAAAANNMKSLKTAVGPTTISNATCQTNPPCNGCNFRIDSINTVLKCLASTCTGANLQKKVCVFVNDSGKNCAGNKDAAGFCDNCNLQDCGNVVNGACTGCICSMNAGNDAVQAWAVCGQ